MAKLRWVLILHKCPLMLSLSFKWHIQEENAVSPADQLKPTLTLKRKLKYPFTCTYV